MANGKAVENEQRFGRLTAIAEFRRPPKVEFGQRAGQQPKGPAFIMKHEVEVLSTSSNKSYTVSIQADCQCDGYRYRGGSCKHIAALFKKIEGEKL